MWCESNNSILWDSHVWMGIHLPMEPKSKVLSFFEIWFTNPVSFSNKSFPKHPPSALPFPWGPQLHWTDVPSGANLKFQYRFFPPELLVAILKTRGKKGDMQSSFGAALWPWTVIRVSETSLLFLMNRDWSDPGMRKRATWKSNSIKENKQVFLGIFFWKSNYSKPYQNGELETLTVLHWHLYVSCRRVKLCSLIRTFHSLLWDHGIILHPGAILWLNGENGLMANFRATFQMAKQKCSTKMNSKYSPKESQRICLCRLFNFLQVSRTFEGCQ